MPEGTQRYSRAKIVLPLRVWLDERLGETLAMQWAHTIDISQSGCRLGGLRTELSPGQTIALQRGQDKALFRVIWSKHLATNENQAGIQAVDCGRRIWAVGPPPSPIAESSTEPSCASEDSPATLVSVPLVFVLKVSASTRIGLLLLNLILALSLSHGISYEWGLGIGLLLLSLALGLSCFHRMSKSSVSRTGGVIRLLPAAPVHV
jgi:hypothetical protein